MIYLYCVSNPGAVKLTSLLTQYLYNNQRLDLPGIGSFLFDSSVLSEAENSKQKPAVMEGITFINNPSITESPDLVAYISTQTGKMKALAAADLDSHLQLAQQFLNIGKPFTFEGIGTLVKVKPKECEFTPISYSAERVKDIHGKDNTKSAAAKDDSSESFLSAPRTKMEWTRPAVALLIILGLALAIAGGYFISKRAASGKQTNPEPELVHSAVIPDSLAIADSIARLKDVATVNTNYKYVLQVSPKKTALRRYNQLKTNLWDVKMETNDSVQYKLFLLLPSLNADTTRVLDSLTVMTGKKVYIEHQN